MNHVRRTARRNPQEMQDPTAVLVRRFDPTGEDLSVWEPLARDADGSIAFLSPPKAKAAALAPPSDADLHVGDIIVTVPAEALSGIEEHATGLYVVTPDGVKAASEPPKDLGGPWLARWGQDAERMLGAASKSKADSRRLVMAACDCAETVLHLVPAGADLPRAATEASRAWCLGQMDLGQVKAASETVAPSKSGYAGTARCAVSGAAWSVSTACYDEEARGELVKCAAWCAAEAVRITNGTPNEVTLRSFAPLVERWIPLPVVLLSWLGYDMTSSELEPDAANTANTPVSTP